MTNHTINTYSFSELSEKSKQKAIANLYDINVNYEWWESVYDDAENIGCKITSFDVDRGSYCNMEFKDSFGEVAENIISEHGKNCPTFKTAMKYLDEYDKLVTEQGQYEEDNDEFQQIEEEIEELDNEFKKSLEEDYRILLSKEYEYLTSSEGIIETIEANEYEFLENGIRY
jgi:hypothetical protein